MEKLLVFCFTVFAIVQGKIYDPCELARELEFVYKLPKNEIATWVCIAKHESLFNTSAVNPGSGDHGLFQISEIFWCSPPGKGYACNAPCSAFEDDDIHDDVSCIKRIFKEHQYLSGNGFNAWVVYPLYCKNDVQKYIENCATDNEIEPFSTTTLNPGDDDDDGDGYEFPPLPVHPRKAKFQKSKLKFVAKQLPSTPFTTKTPSTTTKSTKQQLIGLKNSEYTFRWTPKGFSLVRV